MDIFFEWTLIYHWFLREDHIIIEFSKLFLGLVNLESKYLQNCKG